MRDRGGTALFGWPAFCDKGEHVCAACGDSGAAQVWRIVDSFIPRQRIGKGASVGGCAWQGASW